jgi:hypothetical protein
MQLIATVAALAATVTTVNALGNAIINNNCGFPVYVWPIDAQRNPSDPITVAPGGQYSEAYHALSSGGVSLKIGTTPNKGGKQTQFEYTLASFGASSLWYDGSNVDCTDSDCPFWNYGINLKASDSSCPTRNCAVGAVCSGFYTLWNDDINTLSCSSSADTIMTVCSVNAGGNGAQAKNAAVSSPAPVASTSAPTSSRLRNLRGIVNRTTRKPNFVRAFG